VKSDLVELKVFDKISC